MIEQLRINFFGAPARGKSETASRVFSELRSQHYSAGLVQEWIKGWALRNYQIQFYDQIYVLGKQHHLEYEYLKAGVKNVVTDSPLWLSVFYAPTELKRGIAELVREYDGEYPSLNILLLKDKSAPYEREGRYQDEEGAQLVQNNMVHFMNEIVGFENYQTYYFGQKEEIKQAVLRAAIK
jgi:hypothetical protein